MPPYIYHVISPVTDPKAQTAIFTVLALILLDLVVGIVGAVVTHTFSSEKMRSGLLHKFMELCAMALGAIIDGALVGGFDIATQPLLIAICAYIGIMETGSVLELIKKYDPDANGLVGWLTDFVKPKGE